VHLTWSAGMGHAHYDGLSLLLAKAGNKLFLPLADPLARSREAFVVRKGDPDFLSFLDTWIRCQEDTGWLAERHKYWFGGFAWEDLL